jgi:hypothetical protein
MKRIILLLGIVGTIFYWFSSPRPSTVRRGAPPEISSTSCKPFSPLIAAPRKMISVPNPETVSPDCTALWTSLQSLDLEDTFKEGSVSFPEKSSCQPKPPILEKAHEAFVTECRDFAHSGGEPTSVARDRCLSATLSYRAKITDWLTRELPVTEISDPKILADKLIVRFGEDPYEASEIAERLHEIQPDYYPATKALLISRFLKASQDPDSPVLGEQEAEALRWAREAAPTDEEVGYLDIARSMRTRRAEDLFSAADRLERVTPGSPAAPYARSYAEFEEGDAPSAVRDLKETAQRTHDPLLKRNFLALASAVAHGARPGSLEFGIPLSFTFPKPND